MAAVEETLPDDLKEFWKHRSELSENGGIILKNQSHHTIGIERKDIGETTPGSSRNREDETTGKTNSLLATNQ